MWDDEEPTKRSLGIREKKILYERSGHKCEACEKAIDFLEMQVGHKKAASKGGNATLKNTVALCYKCNNLMGTDNWNVFLRKMGKQLVSSDNKDALKVLSIVKLRLLAKKYGVKVKGRTEEGWLSDKTVSPSKTQYVNALAKTKLSEEEIRQILTEQPKPKKKKRRRRSAGFSLF